MRQPWQKATLILAIVCAMLPAPAYAKAADQTGTVTGNQVNLRTGPGLQYTRIAYLYKGDPLTITGNKNGWYAVSYKGSQGYVYSDYVRLDATVGTTGSGGSPDTSGSSGASGGLLRFGSTGDRVKQLQGNLIMLGYLNSRADGIFGSGTQAAVKKYQSRNGLSPDGIAGSATTSAIAKEVLRIINTVDTAKKYLGLSYAYGGSSPSTGFDCSGLTQYAFAQAGMSIPRVSYEQAAAGISVPRSQLRVGDLVAFNSPVSHVGIYVGDGKFIHSPKPGDVVKLTSLSAMNLTAIRRFTGVLAG